MEWIVCSAIQVHSCGQLNGTYLGLRHNNCFAAMKKARDLVDPTNDSLRIKMLNNNKQGFLTTKNRFVDRHEGMKIALAAGQVEKKERNDVFLYSEDLYYKNFNMF